MVNVVSFYSLKLIRKISLGSEFNNIFYIIKQFVSLDDYDFNRVMVPSDTIGIYKKYY